MRPGLMMPVMLGVGHTGGRHGPVHEHEEEGQGPYGKRVFESNEHSVGLPQRCSLDRLAFLNLGHDIENQLLGQQPALDVFLHNALFIDEHADG
jgi:hypothetical protein